MLRCGMRADLTSYVMAELRSADFKGISTLMSYFGFRAAAHGFIEGADTEVFYGSQGACGAAEDEGGGVFALISQDGFFTIEPA